MAFRLAGSARCWTGAG